MIDAAPYPVLLVGADGTVGRVNPAARLLLRSAEPGMPLADAAPGWLVEAHLGYGDGSPPARGPIGARTFEAHASRGDDGSEVVWWLVDDTDRRLAVDALRVQQERTDFLAEASSRLLSSLNLDRCMRVTARLAAQNLAEAALVIAPSTGRKHPIAYCGPDGVVVRDELVIDPAELPGLAEALQGFPPVPSRWIDPATAPAWLPSAGLGQIGAMVVTALPGHGIPAGALVLLGGSARSSFSEGEEVFARLFAARAGAAMSAARLYAEQASITQTLMRELLPPRVSRLEGAELAAGYRPGGPAERIGGDFYDLHPAADAAGESLIVLGDVCGKGLEAAVLTGKIRNTLRALLPLADDHHLVLNLLNGVLLNDDAHARFVTLVLASLRRVGGSLELRMTNAGHPSPLIVRADGRVETVESKGTLIGVLDQIKSQTVTVVLAPGESCLLYTDGVTEAKGGPLGDELYGEERLCAALEQCAGMPGQAMVEHVQMLASQWTGHVHQDDMALVVVTAPRGAHLSAVGGHGPGRFTA
ncbi:PP2C family protein-serine/threonine phosphatase [Actinocorallia longicatena]|uniref:PP2C family protein-serine/threonine phosphatase n=2 Tax=Actinocorallia longicatena TaxID=111803 RepID=A0ABP6Q6X9_9ACTN